MIHEDTFLNAALDDFIDADVPRSELSGVLVSLGTNAAKPVIEKGLKKLAERTFEADVLAATAGEISENGDRQLGWRIRVRNHTASSFAIHAIKVSVGRNLFVSRMSDAGFTLQPENLSGRLILCLSGGSCEFSLTIDLGRGWTVVPITIVLHALNGGKTHEIKLNLNRADDLGLKVHQQP